MKRSSTALIMLFAMCSMLLFPINVHAQFFGQHDSGREEMKEKREQKIQRIYDQLSLSEEQKKMLAENKAKHKIAKEMLAKDLKSAMQAMGDELKKKDLDLGVINTKRAVLKGLRDQMADERFNAILEVRKILTQEQFGKFIELVQQEKESR